MVAVRISLDLINSIGRMECLVVGRRVIRARCHSVSQSGSILSHVTLCSSCDLTIPHIRTQPCPLQNSSGQQSCVGQAHLSIVCFICEHCSRMKMFLAAFALTTMLLSSDQIVDCCYRQTQGGDIKSWPGCEYHITVKLSLQTCFHITLHILL